MQTRNFGRLGSVSALTLGGGGIGGVWGSTDHTEAVDTVRMAIDSGITMLDLAPTYAVAAGALTDQLDRRVDHDHPVVSDFERAKGFRRLAADLGDSAASLAHRYALSVPGAATVVLGVKNRMELADCLAAEARGPLTDEEFRAVIELRQADAA
jgi:aryl-alcohol dehydrogenase-like predicted oxidoreductase